MAIANPHAPSASYQVAEEPEPAGACVPAVTLSHIIEEYGPIDLLKLDIEGAERPLFEEGDVEWLSDVGLIAIEIHEKKSPGVARLIDDAVQPYCMRVSSQGEYVLFDLKGLLA